MAVATDPAANDARRTLRQPRRRSELTGPDRAVQSTLSVTALLPTLALAFLAYELVREAYPSIVFNGWHFFSGKSFSLGNTYGTGIIRRHGQTAQQGSSFGIVLLVFGTVISSLIALVFAVPISVAGAIILVERVPTRLQGPLGVFLELLAGIPSVVFGLWGVATLGPVLSRDVYHHIAAAGIPYLSSGVTANGEGMLTASLVLAVMVIPIIASTTRELVRSVPVLAKEGAVALGLTKSESVRLVTIPYIRSGIVAASLLGWGRALGETIAVLLISGNFSSAYPHSLFAPFATMAGFIAGELDGALQDSTGMAVHALAEIGLVLLAITLVTNFAGRLITRRFAGGAGLPVGRGV